MIFVGTVGLKFLNIWVAVVYLPISAVFTFWTWPVKHCKYCYYNVTETAPEKKNGKTIMKLLPKNEWKESYLTKHVDCGKKWFPSIGIVLWVFPIIGIVISFFLDFCIYALYSLIGFIALLVIMLVYVRYRVCPSCAFMEECHAAF